MNQCESESKIEYISTPNMQHVHCLANNGTSWKATCWLLRLSLDSNFIELGRCPRSVMGIYTRHKYLDKTAAYS